MGGPLEAEHISKRKKEKEKRLATGISRGGSSREREITLYLRTKDSGQYNEKKRGGTRGGEILFFFSGRCKKYPEKKEKKKKSL